MREREKKRIHDKERTFEQFTFLKENKIENEGLNSYSSFSHVFLGSTSYQRMNCHERITDCFYFLEFIVF